MSRGVNGVGKNHTGLNGEQDHVLSEYLEGELASPERERIEAQLASDADLAREAHEMAAVIRLLHQVPRREPVLDIWSELSPKIEAYKAEEKLGVGARVRLRAGRFLGNVAMGAILFTQALAMNTEAHMRKYLISDPLTLGEGGRAR